MLSFWLSEQASEWNNKIEPTTNSAHFNQIFPDVAKVIQIKSNFFNKREKQMVY